MEKQIEIWFMPDGSRTELRAFGDEGFNTEEVKKWGEGMVTIFSDHPNYSAASQWISDEETWNNFTGPYPDNINALLLVSGLPPLHRRFLSNE